MSSLILVLLFVDTIQVKAWKISLVTYFKIYPRHLKLLNVDKFTLRSMIMRLFITGSSMNAAFAVGRLLEREDARSKLLSMKNFKNTVSREPFL